MMQEIILSENLKHDNLKSLVDVVVEKTKLMIEDERLKSGHVDGPWKEWVRR